MKQTEIENLASVPQNELEEAQNLAFEYEDDGYDDVVIQEVI